MADQGTGQYEQNMTHVDTGAMREAAARIYKKLAKVSSIIETMSNGCEQLHTDWDTPAEKRYEERLRQLVGEVNNTLGVYAELPREINAYAAEYEYAHGVAVTLASMIEEPLWADV